MSVRLMEWTMALLAKEAEGELWLGVTTCPECGALLLPEGVELHRRYHGLPVKDEPDAVWVDQFLPADYTKQMEAQIGELREALERIAAPQSEPFDPRRAYFAEVQDIARAALARETTEGRKDG